MPRPKTKTKARARPKTKKRAVRGITVPSGRRAAALELGKLFKPGMRVALTTHVNADGDGAGSGVALWHLLTARGIRAAITNPTPFPERYDFLLRGADGANKTDQAVKHLERADAIVVLDISDLGRLGHLASVVANADAPVACIDHHVSDGTLPKGPRLIDSTACATGELVYDLSRTLGWELPMEAARALYVAISMDTGGFRFSNTTPRSLQIASQLLGHGLDAEQVYQQVYANGSPGRVRLLGEVLETLVVEPDLGLAWVTVPPGALERQNAHADDLEGVVEYPRSIKGIRLALMFRQLASGRIKISFRSVGDVDVAQMAQRFGGGGHRKAAGASLEGTLPAVQEQVLREARMVLGAP